MVEITLKEIPTDRDSEESLVYCDVGGDRCFEIIGNGAVTLGHAFIAENTETPSGIPCKTYINWIELLTVFQHRGFLKPIMDVLSEKFGEIYLSAVDGTEEKYRGVGAESMGIDDFTGLEIFRYKKGAV